MIGFRGDPNPQMWLYVFLSAASLCAVAIVYTTMFVKPSIQTVRMDNPEFLALKSENKQLKLKLDGMKTEVFILRPADNEAIATGKVAWDNATQRGSVYVKGLSSERRDAFRLFLVKENGDRRVVRESLDSDYLGVAWGSFETVEFIPAVKTFEFEIKSQEGNWAIALEGELAKVMEFPEEVQTGVEEQGSLLPEKESPEKGPSPWSLSEKTPKTDDGSEEKVSANERIASIVAQSDEAKMELRRQKMAILGERETPSAEARDPAGDDSGNLLEQVSRLVQSLRFEEALKVLEGVIEKEEELDKAYRFKGGVLLKLNRPQDAIKAFEKASELAPELDSNLFDLGSAHFLSGDYAKAIEFFKAYENKADPTLQGPIVTFRVFLCELFRDNKKEVDAILAKAEPTPLNPLHYFCRAAIHFHQRERNEALDLVHSALTIYPQNTCLPYLSPFFELGWLQLGQEQSESEFKLDAPN